MVSRRTWGVVLLVLGVLFTISAVYGTINTIAFMVTNYGGILISGATIGYFIGMWILPIILLYLGTKWIRQK